MNVEELESIIRDELRRDAANTPSGRQLRVAVLDAVADLPMAERPVRRWAVPLLVAAAVVALAIAATLLPRAFGKHSQPAHPKPSPSPSLPAAPTSVKLACPKGQQQVTGASARYSNSAGDPRYVYDYYCVGPDGSRTSSLVDAFRMVGNRLVHVETVLLPDPQYVMSMTGSAGALRIRVYDNAIPATFFGPVGQVLDLAVDVDSEDGSTDQTTVAGPCLATDLTVQWTQANEPTPHTVLQLTNRSGKTCVVWGNPRYTQVAGEQRVTVHSVLRGPAGGLAAGEAWAPPLLLQPGQSAYSAVGTEPVSGHCFVPTVSVALANGVRLGTHTGDCSLVSYPLVRAENGSEESAAPASATSSCSDGTDLVVYNFASVKARAGRAGMTIELAAAGSKSCTITGYPNVSAVDGVGNPRHIAQTLRSALGGLTHDQIPQVTVAPGQPVSALLDWSGSRATGDCGSGGLSFTIGGNTESLASGSFCDLQVHPFVSGSTGSD
jgi:hypothetical protein